MVGLAGALVLNIGTLSRALGRGDAARRARRRTSAGSRSCSTRSAPARRATGPRRRSGSSTRSTSPSCAGTRARSRRSSASRPRCAGSSRSAPAATRPSSRAAAARTLGVVASVTGPVDHVSDGERVARGRERPRAARLGHRHRLHVDRDHRLLPRRERTTPLEAAAEALVAFGVAGEDAAATRKGPGIVPRRALRRALQPRPGDARRAREDRA